MCVCVWPRKKEVGDIPFLVARWSADKLSRKMWANRGARLDASRV